MTSIENGFYVDEAGKVCSTAEVPDGMHYEFEDKLTYRNVALIVTATGEVHEEYVLWNSLEALSAAGVDVSGFTNRQSMP